MKNIKTSGIILIVCFSLIACKQQYWYRNKVKIERTVVQSIKVEIENKVPFIFNDRFERDLINDCEKEFIKMGYTTAFKDTPDYVATIQIGLDSFPVKGIYRFGMGGPSSFLRAYKKESVKAILFRYQLFNTRFQTFKWFEENDIYYFDDNDKNSRRSRNMIKYTIRYGT
ncbi:MAG: hypothetical protein ACK5UI_10255 [Bacteroidota bacterium]|jgi:hypothetical protein